jgi:hypothetical protein
MISVLDAQRLTFFVYREWALFLVVYCLPVTRSWSFLPAVALSIRRLTRVAPRIAFLPARAQ